MDDKEGTQFLHFHSDVDADTISVNLRWCPCFQMTVIVQSDFKRVLNFNDRLTLLFLHLAHIYFRE